MASRGCRVILADILNAESAKERIIEETNNPNIVAKYLNLASLQSVRDFAKDIIETETELNILVNHAGIGLRPVTETTKDGLNLVMQTNYFGAFLLTHLFAGECRILQAYMPAIYIYEYVS